MYESIPGKAHPNPVSKHIPTKARVISKLYEVQNAPIKLKKIPILARFTLGQLQDRVATKAAKSAR